MTERSTGPPSGAVEYVTDGMGFQGALIQLATLKRRCSELFASQLGRALIGQFVVIIMVQAAFLSYLGHEAVAAQHAAEKENRILRVASSLNTLCELLREHRNFVDDGLNHPTSPDTVRDYNKSAEKIRTQVRVIAGQWPEAGLRRQSLETIGLAVARLLADTDEVFAADRTPLMRWQSYNAYFNESSALYAKASTRLTEVYSTLDQKQESLRDPFPFIQGMLLFNVLAALILVVWLQRTIITPVVELSKNCDLLATSKVLPAPTNKHNEIADLQKAFHDMSVLLAESEKGRRSYIAILQESQLKAIETVREQIASVRGRVPEAAHDIMDVVESGMKRMMNLIRRLTEMMSQEASDKVVLQYELAKTTAMFKNAVAAVAALAGKQRVRITVNDPAAELTADPQLVERILINLLSNAIKFSPEGSEIRLTGSVQNNVLYVAVIDQGPGINEADQAKLFAKFSQLGNRSSDSSGLGLAICKQLAEAHGGTVGCKSKPGQGSEFWIQLPVDRSDVVPEPATSRQREPFRGRSIRTPLISILCVLIVGQALSAANLYSRFREGAAYAAEYSANKQTIVRTQVLLVTFLNWRQQTLEAVRVKDFQRVVSVAPLLKEASQMSVDIAAEFKTEPMRTLMLEVADQLKNLRRFLKERVAFGTLDRADMPSAYKQGSDMGRNVESRLFSTLQLENERLATTYNRGTQVMADIVKTAAGIAILDLVLLVLLVGYALVLLSQINLLGAKVKKLAGVASPTYSLTGGGECAYLDRALTDAAIQIAQEQQRRQQLMAAINHDLRTPLTSILGSFELLSDLFSEQFDDTVRETFNEAEMILFKLLDQINNLLAIEKVEAGLLAPRYASVELSTLVAQAAERVSRRWKGKDVRLATADGDESPVTIVGDGMLIEWVFRALIDNAIAASAAGAVVSIKTGKQSDKAFVTVSDAGSGIPDNIQGQLFERFRFIDGTPMTGLGLPLAQRLCTLLNGQLIVEHSSPSGTRLNASFPVDFQHAGVCG